MTGNPTFFTGTENPGPEPETRDRGRKPGTGAGNPGPEPETRDRSRKPGAGNPGPETRGRKPGTGAGELAAEYDDYRRWFEQMRQMGVNTLRIYTLHFPRFYEALADHNEEHPDDPLYLLHGIWLDEENPGDDLLALEEIFDRGIDEVVDCAHGDCSINHRLGRAYGDYDADVSQWIMGWIIGREVHPDEVLITNEAHPEMTDFDGEHFAVDDADPVEVWFAERLERLVARELARYGATRPVSVSSWPTLDPLAYPTESSDFSTEDIASFDATRIDLVDAKKRIRPLYRRRRHRRALRHPGLRPLRHFSECL